jgi:catechol 2,3-dioxygenase-like lactoylglutathione lyase family enzyme
MRAGAAGLARGNRSWQALALSDSEAAAMKIDRIDHLNLTVADLDRSLEFYRRVLGMRAESVGEGRAALLFGNQKINLDAAGSAAAMSAQPRLPAHICFVTEAGVEEVLAHLERCGVPVRMGPAPRAGAVGSIQSVYIDDPDKNSIEISSY